MEKSFCFTLENDSDRQDYPIILTPGNGFPGSTNCLICDGIIFGTGGNIKGSAGKSINRWLNFIQFTPYLFDKVPVFLTKILLTSNNECAYKQNIQLENDKGARHIPVWDFKPIKDSGVLIDLNNYQVDFAKDSLVLPIVFNSINNIEIFYTLPKLVTE